MVLLRVRCVGSILVKGKSFYLDNRLLGVKTFARVDGRLERVFVTHVKKPERHFYVKAHGYPVNEELLHLLKNIDIDYILIPEDGRSGFRVYLACVSDYLSGVAVDNYGEKQRCIPLKNLRCVNVDRDNIENVFKRVK